MHTLHTYNSGRDLCAESALTVCYQYSHQALKTVLGSTNDPGMAVPGPDHVTTVLGRKGLNSHCNRQHKASILTILVVPFSPVFHHSLYTFTDCTI